MNKKESSQYIDMSVIKFVDFGGQLYNARTFGFYDESICEFLSFMGMIFTAWESDFENRFLKCNGVCVNNHLIYEIEGFKKLCPSWVFDADYEDD